MGAVDLQAERIVMTDDGELRLVVGVKEAARALGVSPNTLRDLCHQGKVPHVRLGHQFKFPVWSLKQWLATESGVPVPEDAVESARQLVEPRGY